MLIWDFWNIDHIARHQISPDEVEQVIANNPIDLGRQIRNGEARRLHLGETDNGRVLVVVVTDSDDVRPVTAHEAKRILRSFYRTQKANRDAENS